MCCKTKTMSLKMLLLWFSVVLSLWVTRFTLHEVIWSTVNINTLIRCVKHLKLKTLEQTPQENNYTLPYLPHPYPPSVQKGPLWSPWMRELSRKCSEAGEVGDATWWRRWLAGYQLDVPALPFTSALSTGVSAAFPMKHMHIMLFGSSSNEMAWSQVTLTTRALMYSCQISFPVKRTIERWYLVLFCKV